MTAKETEVPPLTTFTLAGTVATFVLELVSLMVAPAEVAGPSKLTVPLTVVLEPPIT